MQSNQTPYTPDLKGVPKQLTGEHAQQLIGFFFENGIDILKQKFFSFMNTNSDRHCLALQGVTIKLQRLS